MTDPFEELFGKRAGHMRMGLDRTRRALQVLQKYQTEKKIILEDRALTILVGGTNGKGSTCGMLCQLFESIGLKTALYSSPHLIDYSERFFVPSAPVSHQEILAVYETLKQKILPTDLFQEMSFFELSTLIAYKLFLDRELDVVVFEVGLGGRLDSTNALSPHISAIASIDFDHQEYLGHTLLEIATEKAAIRRIGRPLLWGEGPEKWERYPSLMADLEATQKPFYHYGKHFFVRDHEVVFQNFHLSIPPRLRQAPDFLHRNLALAFGCFCTSLETEHPLIAKIGGKPWTDLEARLQKGFAETTVFPPTLVGRAQEMLWTPAKGPQRNVYLDCAHNLAGIREVCKTLQRERREPQIRKALVTILRDKACNEMLDLLRGQVDELLLFQVPHERSITKQDIANRHGDLPLYSSFASLLETLILDNDAEPLLICGSIYGLGEVLRVIGHELKPRENPRYLG